MAWRLPAAGARQRPGRCRRRGELRTGCLAGPRHPGDRAQAHRPAWVPPARRTRASPAPAAGTRLPVGTAQHSTLSVAATVTVVTDATAEDVLRAFGADSDRPDSLQQIRDDVIARTAALDGLDF